MQTRLVASKPNAPTTAPAERGRRRGHDVLHGARSAPPPLRRALRAWQGRRRRARRGVRGRCPRRLGSGRNGGLPLRSEEGGARRHGADCRGEPRLRPRDRYVDAGSRPPRPGSRQRVLVGGSARLARLGSAGRAPGNADRDGDGVSRVRRAARPRPRRGRDGRGHPGDVPGRRRDRFRPVRVSRHDTRRAAASTAALRPALTRPAATRSALARRAAGSPVRRPHRPRAVEAARARLGRRRHRAALPRHCGDRDGAQPAARPFHGHARPARPGAAGPARLDRGLARPRLGRPALLVAALVLAAGIAYGAFYTPGMALVSDTAERNGIAQGLAFGV